jgi:hypothetical protein
MSETLDRSPVDPDAVLAELLGHCRSAAEECFQAGRDGETFSPDRASLRLAGVKVIRTSLEVIAAIKAQTSSRDDSEKKENRKTKTIPRTDGIAGNGEASHEPEAQ